MQSAYLIRRDNMIQAYKDLTRNKTRYSQNDYGYCKYCGDLIQWVKTKNNKMRPVIPNSSEVHIVHCGKRKWTDKDWGKALNKILIQEKKQNTPPKVTIGSKLFIGEEAQYLIDKANNEPYTDNVPWTV